MADATLKLGLDVSLALAEIKKLKNIGSKLNIGKDMSDQLAKAFQKIKGDLEKLGKIDMSKLDDKQMTAHVKQVKELENQQKNINKLLQEAYNLHLQKQGLTAKDLTKYQQDVQRHEIRLKQIEKERQMTLELLAAQDKRPGKEDRTDESDQRLIQVREGMIRAQEQILSNEKATNEEKTKALAIIEQHKRAIEEANARIENRKAIQTMVNKLSTEENNIKTRLLPLAKQLQDSTKEQAKQQQEITTHTDKASQAQRKLAEDAKKVGAETAAANRGYTAAGDAVTKLSDKMKRLAEFTIAAFALRAVRQFFTSALGFIRDLDKSLTEIATVTGKTREEMWGMAEEFNRIGRELGRTTNEVAKASVIFYRQGLNTNQVLAMVRASTISAAIANTDAAEASNRLTAALRGYGMEAEQAMTVADKMAALAAKSASSFDELSYAMTKTASSAAVAGIDIDHLYAYLAKVIETTRYNIAA